jgi:hypothetical protein
MRRSLLFSCALHGVIVLIALATQPRRQARREPVSPVEIAVDPAAPPIPPVAGEVNVPTQGGGAGPAEGKAPVVADVAPPRRRRLVAIRAAPGTTPEPAPAAAAPLASEQGSVEVAPAVATEPPGAPGDQPAGAADVDGAGAGNGLGDGLGDGFGPGRGGSAMTRELHARVLGNEAFDVRPREDAPTISHDEATALRTRDRFPRLPESVWPEWRPYIVRLEICVAEDGRVREAVLRSAASPRLDPLVLAAAKTWQYRPRVVDGKPAPFCHGVVIKYERW